MTARRKKEGPMRYKNVSGQDRVLMVDKTSVTKVEAGATVEIVDEGLIAGLVGQESLWQPVTEPDSSSSSDEKKE